MTKGHKVSFKILCIFLEPTLRSELEGIVEDRLVFMGVFWTYAYHSLFAFSNSFLYML